MTHDPNDSRDRDPGLDADREPDGNAISPLPGEPGIPNVAARQRVSMSKKGLLAVALLVGSLIAVAAVTIQRFSSSGKKADEAESKLVRDKPTAATAEPRRLEMPPAPSASAAMPTAPRIPALTPTADELAEPIGVRRTGSAAPASGGPKVAAFEAQVTALTERAKVQAVAHVLARTDEAARRSIEFQARAMADAARVALGAELGATLQRLQAAAQPRPDAPRRRWEPWLTHAAAAATASAATWTVAIMLWGR